MARRASTAYAAGLLALLLVLVLPALVEAQSEYRYTNHDDTITITGYTGPGGAVTIPSALDHLPVTSIGDSAFYGCTNLTSVTIPDGITNIGDDAFDDCTSLTSITLPNSVGSIGRYTFYFCTSLTSVTIPNSVGSIGDQAFCYCTSLASVTIPNSVTSIGDQAFYACSNLAGVYFQGNAPSRGFEVFEHENNDATVYYLPGTTGWGAMLGSLPAALWLLPNPVILNNSLSFGVQTNRFGFIISWATNMSVVVEACTNLANPTWSPVATNTLTGGSSYFSDPQWRNSPVRLYRLHWP